MMKTDPTKTLTLRNRTSRTIDARFNRVKRAVRSAFNVGGLVTNTRMAQDGEFEFLSSREKIPAFESFLQEQIDSEILRLSPLTPQEIAFENHWLTSSVSEGYRRGAVKSRLAAERNIPQLNALPDFNPFANPNHVERGEIIFRQVYSDLVGVTEAMSKQMSRTLAQGIIQGATPRKVAANMSARIDKIGKTRAKLIARTEIIHAHNLAAIQEASNLSAETGVEIKMEWNASLDDRVRHTHEERHGKLFDAQAVIPLLGEPNCRCSVIPSFDV